MQTLCIGLVETKFGAIPVTLMVDVIPVALLSGIGKSVVLVKTFKPLNGYSFTLPTN